MFPVGVVTTIMWFLHAVGTIEVYYTVPFTNTRGHLYGQTRRRTARAHLVRGQGCLAGNGLRTRVHGRDRGARQDVEAHALCAFRKQRKIVSGRDRVGARSL